MLAGLAILGLLLAVRVGTSGLAPAHSSAPAGLASLPVAAQGPVASALGRADRAYWVNSLSARNPAQDLRFAFSPSGALVRAGSASERLSLVGFGRAGAVRPLGAGEPVARDNRVTYELGSVREWFANGPLGLEQGFDVARAPAGGAGRLEFGVSLTGSLRARLRGDAITLSGRGASLRYAGLVATDAGGRRLPAWMSVRGGRLIISVDDRGARYPVRVDPMITQQAELTSKDGTTNDGFGTSVAISGDTIVVGAPYQGIGGGSVGFGPGAVYVFTAPSAGDWSAATESAELTVAGDTTAPDDLGTSVAISGDTIYAGAPGTGISGTTTGAVYAFDEPNGGWAKEPAAPNANQSSVLTIPDGSVGDAFGYSISVSGGTVVAGAPEEQVGSNAAQGAVYVFQQPPNGWGASGAPIAKLTASDGDANNMLGTEVATDGNTVVAGVSPNESTGKPVYVWTMPTTGWNHEPSTPATQTAELTASDGHAGNGLGSSVAVSGDTIAAGALNHSISPSFGQGAVYVWTMPTTGWAAATGAAADQAAELTASDAERGNTLGVSVAIDGNAVVAGADSQDDGGGPGNRDGAVYVFVEPAGGWKSEPATPHANQTDELTASDGAPGDFLGASVATDGAAIVAGAGGHKVGSNASKARRTCSTSAG